MGIQNTIHYIWRFKVFIMSIYSHMVNTLMSYWNVFHLLAHTWNNSKLFYCDLCARKCVHACMCVCVRERERGRELVTDAHFTVVLYHLTCLTYISQRCVLLLLGPRNLTFPSFAFFSFLFPSSSLPPISLLPPSLLSPSLSPPFIFLLLLLPSSLSFLFYLFHLLTYSTIIYWLFFMYLESMFIILWTKQKKWASDKILEKFPVSKMHWF